MSISIKHLMDIISKRAVSFLNDETRIIVDRQDIKLLEINRLELNYLTSLVTVGTSPHIFVIFSYEKKLIEKIFEVYTEELDIIPEERLEYMEETAGDVLNIIVGNAIAKCQNDGTAISLSPPIVISSAESIAKSRTVKFFINNLNTIHGNMSIFCVCPNELFEV
ncbi:MAG: chemotaxis protein CheX [Desulfamplus sp.]|nr:chemotaxis protein CheX [Desulfamplus sp.]MBF0413708.1 chemotaxis protein CheX [Desulfamplus sp.]